MGELREASLRENVQGGGMKVIQGLRLLRGLRTCEIWTRERGRTRSLIITTLRELSGEREDEILYRFTLQEYVMYITST